MLAVPGTLEVEHWRALAVVHNPICRQCSIPLPEGLVEAKDVLCPSCLADPPSLTQMRASLAYNEASKPLVLGLKHGGERGALEAFARWMVRAGGPMLSQTDEIVPVPLHPLRAAERGFNQAKWLARAIAPLVSVPVEVQALLRVRPSAHERRRSVAGAFAVDPRLPDMIAGKQIVLIDDVLTTGAIAEAFAAALLQAKARCVVLLTLARVVHGRELSI